MKDAWRSRVPAVALIAIAGLSAGGCGGGSSSSSEPLSKAQILKKGDQICKERLEEKDVAVKATLKTFSPSEIAKPSKRNLEEMGNSILPPIQKMTDEFGELQAKEKQNRAELEDLTTKLEAGLKTAEAHLDRLVHTDPFEKAGIVAHTYGFTTCSF